GRAGGGNGRGSRAVGMSPPHREGSAMGIHDLWLFVIAGLVLNVTPGPDMALIMARSTRYGTRAGMAAALGIGAGTFVHIAAAAIGMSAIILASALAFTLLKWMGALYLIYIGLRMLLRTPAPGDAEDVQRPGGVANLRSVFWQGFLTNVLNPKVAIFFLAFLPQFIDANAPSKVLAFVVLGLWFDVTGTIWNLMVAWSSGRLLASKGFRGAARLLERSLGALFVVVGVRLALAERP